MDNRIKLTFDKSLTCLADNPYGRTVYEEQVKGKIDYSQIAYIEFPEQITRIASSFVQGFFEEIVKKVGILGVGKKVIVVAPGVDVEKTIYNNLQ